MNEMNLERLCQIKQGLSNATLLFYVGQEQTYLIVEPEKEDGIKLLPFGAESLSRDYFKHLPPTEAEIEMAITKVEDELMPLVATIRPLAYQLASVDPFLPELTKHAFPQDEKSLTVREVEAVFTRMAAIITGRPASLDTLPEDNTFSAYVLILREVMHHLGFDHVLVVSIRP